MDIDTSDIIDTARSDKQALLDALASAGAKIDKEKSFCCPFHDDTSPSSGIYEYERAWLFKCHSCGVVADVWEVRARNAKKDRRDFVIEAMKAEAKRRKEKTVNATPPRLFKSLEETQAAIGNIGVIEATYTYGPNLFVHRLTPWDKDRKTFRPASRRGSAWVMLMPEGAWPLYKSDVIGDTSLVVIVEGEKCVDALRSIGIAAVTSPCGAGKAGLADWSALSGRSVLLWPDLDEPGHKHMAQVRAIVEALEKPCLVTLFDPALAGLSAVGADVADWIEEHDAMTPEDMRSTLLDLFAKCSPINPSSELAQYLEDIISGKIREVKLPWPRTSSLAHALLPGTVTLICGNPGCGKSFFLLQSAAYWQQNHEEFAIFELEETVTFHLHRAVAQSAGCSDIMRLDWVSGNPHEARNILAQQRDFSERFAKRLTSSKEAPTLESIGNWIETQAKRGVRVIAIDPITAAASNGKPWIEDQAFMVRIGTIAKEFGCSIILVIHPKKGQRGKILSLDDMAGGSSFGRFSQTVIWLEEFALQEEIINDREVMCNRSAILMKSRNGPGSGGKIGFHFDGGTLRFKELGIIDSKKKKKQKGHGNTRMYNEPQDSEDQFR